MNLKTAALTFGTIVIIAGTISVVKTKWTSSSTKTDDITMTTSVVESTAKVESTIDSSISQSKRTIKDVINPERIVLILTEISGQSMAQAKAQLEFLDKTDGDIYILLSSPGGSVFAGESLITSMQSAKNKVHTVCTDFCASMAAIIHQHGVKRYAYDRATLMFHDASGGFQGQFSKMRKLFDYIQRKLDKTNTFIASRSKLSYQEFMSYVSQDFWIDAEDAERKGLVDSIVKVAQINGLLMAQDSDLRRRNDTTTNGAKINDMNPYKVLPLTFGNETNGQ